MFLESLWKAFTKNVRFVTIPSLSWSKTLKKTKLELELLTDINMVHFLKIEFEVEKQGS